METIETATSQHEADTETIKQHQLFDAVLAEAMLMMESLKNAQDVLEALGVHSPRARAAALSIEKTLSKDSTPKLNKMLLGNPEPQDETMSTEQKQAAWDSLLQGKS